LKSGNGSTVKGRGISSWQTGSEFYMWLTAHLTGTTLGHSFRTNPKKSVPPWDQLHRFLQHPGSLVDISHPSTGQFNHSSWYCCHGQS